MALNNAKPKLQGHAVSDTVRGRDVTVKYAVPIDTHAAVSDTVRGRDVTVKYAVPIDTYALLKNVILSDSAKYI